MLTVDGPAKEAKCEDLEKIVLGDNPEKFFQVGAQLHPKEKKELVEFLKGNVDVFAWNTYKALGGFELHLSSFECQSICHP